MTEHNSPQKNNNLFGVKASETCHKTLISRMQETGVVSIGHIAKKLHGTLNDRTCITLGSSQTYLSLSFDQSERYDWLKI